MSISFQNGKKLAMGGEEEALEDIGISSKTPKAVVMWMEELKLITVKTEEIDEKVQIEDLSRVKRNIFETNRNEIFPDGFSEIKEESGEALTNTPEIKDKVEVNSQEINKLKITAKKLSNLRSLLKTGNKYVGSHSLISETAYVTNEPGNFLVSEARCVPTKSPMCDICKTTVCNIKVHRRKIHGHVSTLELVPCDHCYDWFPSNEALNEHIPFHDLKKDLLSKSVPRQYCKLCSYHCYARNGKGNNTATLGSGEKLLKGDPVMKHHMRDHEEEKHACEQCGKVYNSKRRVQIHKRSCGLVFKCDQCPAGFKRNNSLEEHILGQHQKQHDFSCGECSKKLTGKKSLLNHSRMHKENENIVCPGCGKVLKNDRSLTYHRLTHSNNREFSCTWQGCGKAFNVQYDLNIHIRVHTREKPFKCNQCEQAFRKHNHRSRHQKLHTGEKPHICQTCGKGFIQRSNMRVHSSSCVSNDTQTKSS